MFPLTGGRLAHCCLLTLAWAALCLVNLGTPSLWDIDEGNNAECAREMLEAENWIVPTFNFDLRVDKPALLYWLQMLAYRVFGISEFSARLPSALAALAAVLLTYELGRRLFGPGAGLLAGLILSSTVLFGAAAHFANPDALLNACCLLSFFLFWRDFERGKDGWLAWGGISIGLAMLAKGPSGIVLPCAALFLFLLWQRQLGRIWRRTALLGCLVFLLVAVPWYAWVGADTRGTFLKGFFLDHNVGRFLSPMENHRGPVGYYLLVLMVGFAPWSSFFALAGWHTWQHTREQRGDPRYRFLACWIGVYLAFFTLSKTKLPNYVLPLYPPLALLLAHALDRWRARAITPPAWLVHLSLSSLVLTGVLTTAGMLLGGGAIGGTLLRGRHLPGLENWAFLGAVPVLAALLAWWRFRQDRRGELLTALGLGAVAWLGLLLGFGVQAVDRYKAPRPLGELLRSDQPEGDILIAAYDYFQPSLVFYCQYRIDRLGNVQEVLDRLNYPLPSYVILSAAAWEHIRLLHKGPVRELGRHRDLYRSLDAVLISNQPGGSNHLTARGGR